LFLSGAVHLELEWSLLVAQEWALLYLSGGTVESSRSYPPTLVFSHLVLLWPSS
jgi:hypothetical protein